MRLGCLPLQAQSECHLQALRLQLKGLPYAQIEKEISEGRRSLAACGIPAADVVGFRGPLLETDSNTRKALKALGFLYDRRGGRCLLSIFGCCSLAPLPDHALKWGLQLHLARAVLLVLNLVWQRLLKMCLSSYLPLQHAAKRNTWQFSAPRPAQLPCSILVYRFLNPL